MTRLRLAVFSGLGLFLLSCTYAVQAQTTVTVYHCADLAREGQTAHLGSECSGWTWSSPNRNALVATCGANTCSWNSNTRWRRVETVAASSAISVCTGTVSGRNCSREAWGRRDSVFSDAPPPPPPVSQPRITSFTIIPAVVFTGQPVAVSWQSVDAVSCRSSWAADVPLSGSQSMTIVIPMDRVEVSVTCTSPAGEYGVGAGFTVLTKTPKCYPKYPQDSGKVAVKAISMANFTIRYQVMAVYFCQTPDGPQRQAWVLGTETGLQQLRKWLSGIFDEADVRAQCEASECEILPNGALKTELEAFADLQTAEELGVIE